MTRLLTLGIFAGAQLSAGYKVAPAGVVAPGAGVVVPAAPLVGEPPVLKADFTKPMDIPEAGMEAAMEVMRSGRLFRYTQPAETSQVSQAEVEFAEMVGQKYALGVNSCSSAIMIAMIVCGVESGDEVITNGLTFTALPSTIMRLGADPVLVEATPNWTMDLDDLEKKAAAHPKAKVLVLSHMRGKIAHMDRVVEICEKHGLTLVEDCAHSCGVKWKGRQIGYHAAVSAYSTQSDKVINSGEGGFITSDDPEMMAKAIYLSGAYEARYKHHIAAPDAALCAAAPAPRFPLLPRRRPRRGENRPGPRRRAGSPPAGAARRRPGRDSPDSPPPPPPRRRAPLRPTDPRRAAPSPHPQLRGRHDEDAQPLVADVRAHRRRPPPAHREPPGARRQVQRAVSRRVPIPRPAAIPPEIAVGPSAVRGHPRPPVPQRGAAPSSAPPRAAPPPPPAAPPPPHPAAALSRSYDRVVSKLRTMPQIVVPEQHPEVEGVGDHLNFYLKDVTKEQNAAFIATAKALGVPLGWFASKINARNHVNWRKFGSPTFELPNTDALLATAFDLKMPPHFTDAEMDKLADVLVYSLAAATAPPCDENDETCVDA